MANIVMRRNQPAAPLIRRFGEWDPFERMRELMQWEPFQDIPGRWFAGEGQYAPMFDVREEKDVFIFKADVPGFKQEDVEISVTGNRLTISGKRDEETANEAGSYYCRERLYGSFSRSFTLPDSVNADQIEASMTDGVLMLRVPKTAEAQPKRIAVKSTNGGERAKNKG
jgi:HSP20 family protein